MDVTTNRHKFIGGSDVAAILGLNRYKTPYEVWDEKKNGNNPFTGNQATEWGTKLEPVIITHFEQLHKVKVYENNSRYISTVYDFLGCHPDGLFQLKRDLWLLEVKTVSSTAYKHWANELPLEYYCQVQHNMFVTGTKQAKFVCLVLDDRNYFEIDVNYDEEFVNHQNTFLIEWWNRYIIGDESPVKMVADFEKSNPKLAIAEADEEAVKDYAKLIDIKAKIKELTEQKDALEDALKLKIGDATELMHGLDTLATWRPKTQVRVETKKLKEEQPDIFLKYAKETTSRTFLIKL
jgi:putative phage-type endonuclease